MIEAMLMCGAQGPSASWEVVGSTSLLTSGPLGVIADFPAGTQEGDLVIALMSPLNEAIPTAMVSAGDWAHLTPGQQDYLCTARYRPGLEAPRWQKGASNSLFVAVIVFRAAGWSVVQLVANNTPAIPVTLNGQASNQLLVNIGVAPGTSNWVGYMPSPLGGSRLSRRTAPAMQVYSESLDDPGQYPGIYMTPFPCRNLILTAF